MNFKTTRIACFAGYIVQAIVNNFAPLLFLTFQNSYGLSLDRLALLVSVNFGTQLLVDFLASRYAVKAGYRFCMVFAHFTAAAGLAGLAVLPRLISPYGGLMIAVILYAVGGGLLEVLVTPIIEACPSQGKTSQISFLHSFYCWGQCLVILLSTLFFARFGTDRWQILACIWAILPLLNGFVFLKAPLRTLEEERGEGMTAGQLFRQTRFWLLLLMMFAAGAAELAMAQWASAFAEAGLGVSKAAGDLAGPCMFAVLMGLSRLLFAKLGDRISQERGILLSCTLGVAGYLLAALAPVPALGLAGCGLCGFAAGPLWPGSYSIASRSLPTGGTAMFAFMALCGDLGGAAGPAMVGLISDAAQGQLSAGLLAAVAFPVLMAASILAFLWQKKRP